MSETDVNLPLEQRAIWRKCFHPTGTFVEFSREDVDGPIPQRFEKMVQRFGDRPAVKSRTETLTYSELNNLANRLARRILTIRPYGAEPVAVLVNQKTALICAILAILKTGKFVVLLDPSFPKARTLEMLENSQSTLIVADRENVDLAIELLGPKGEVLDLDLSEPGIRAEEVRTSINSKDLAFVFYTSGSTGDPKGVMQTHRNILHNLLLRMRVYNVSQHDRISLLTSGTSHAVVNMFLALLNGAASLTFDVQKEGVTSLGSWLVRERISICFISGPLFRAFYESFSGHESFPHLRAVRLTSEGIYDADVSIYKKIVSPQCVLVNGLSSSETGPLTKYLIDHTTTIGGTDVPVGFANPDKEIFLVDDNGDRIGPNEVGEIVVRSRYLSPGYWRRPDLTQMKFKPDPQEEGGQIYFTGDLGIMLPDGCLFYRGRKDLRVKIRGYGVEVAEIESVLRDYPAIGEAVVVARGSESGEARLVAYFTCPSQPRASISELRRFLWHKLPDYMIPSAFIMLDAMPLTSSGKVDRRALPDPKNTRRGLNTPLVAPRTSNEEKLVKIWANLLGIDRIGVHDNFFDLGGHSLLAMRVISQIRDDLQVELSLRNFFETPTVAALASYLETTRALRVGVGMFSIPTVSRDREILPSFAQQSLWFTDQMESGSPAYHLFSATKIRGPLNVTTLEQSFNEIIRRHEVLRTVFKSVNGQPFQFILPALTIGLSVVDLRDIASPIEQEAEVRRLSTTEAGRPFNLSRGPLLRATLLRLTEDTHVLFLTIHHIIFDGWSRKILVRELATIYEAFSSGRPTMLPALPIQYADFAQWQRRRLEDKALEEQLAYWKKQLANLSVLKLPSDRPRQAIRTFKGARQSFTVDEEIVARLKILARQEGVTLFMMLLAAYLTLLHRYTGQSDIGIGSPISGRDRSDLESLIGFFLNMLVLRTDLSGNPTFRELLSRVRKVCVEAYTNQDVPFEKVVQELQPERSLSLNPLFQATFALQDGPTCLLEPAGVTAEDLDLGSGIASFDLQLFVIEDEASLDGWLIYNTDLFDASSIARMTNHFQTMLEAVVVNPDHRIGDLAMLTEAEKHQLLVEWNENKRDYPKTKCIHELFEAQGQRTPDAVATVFGNHQLTYKELNERANQVACYLQKLGVGPDALVAIRMERSLEMVVGVLGILKAGAAYVPLDPEYPGERLAFMMADAQVSVLLTQESLLERGGLRTGDRVVQRICLDSEWQLIARENDANLENNATPSNLAYVIYTSGSTGQPKGVMISHDALVNHMHWMQETFRFSKADSVIQKTPVSFDASVWEIFAPLLAGGRLIVAQPQGHRDSAYLSRLIHDQEATVLQVVPSMLREMLQDRAFTSCTTLRLVFCGGEVLPIELLQKFHACFGYTPTLWNLYGPTEATIDATYWECKPNSEQTRVPIGRPIANTQIHILDSHLQSVPVGVMGELHIGGAGLARGYLNRPELTAEKFVANPFSSEAGARLYKTGDRARYLPDGNIEFLGRMDDQVKIRGYRIEVGEIKAVLGQHPSVRESVVLAREDNSGDKRLVAYVVGADSKLDELRNYLKQKLPEYMVPSAFVLLDALPLTPNGKVNRKALPVPNQSGPERESYTAPRTPVEEILTTVWAEVLNLNKIGIHDNFFDLGGHSLLATRVVARLGKILNVEIPLRFLFEAPTIQELAQRIEAHHGGEILSEVKFPTEEETQDII